MKAQLTVRSSLLFLTFVVLGVYYPAIFSPFNSVDDPGTVHALLNNDSFTLQNIFTPRGAYYRPLLVLSFYADKYLWGLHESFMHLENIVFHLLNVLMLYAVARRACLASGSQSLTAPLMAALLFAMHPINTESVNWISGRTDPLACFFLLLSSFLLLKPGLSPAGSLWAALSMLTACLAKETAIFFLPAALIFPFFLDEGERRQTLLRIARDKWLHIAIFVAAGSGFFLFRHMMSPKRDEGVAVVLSHVGGAQSAEAAVNLRLPLKAAGFYLKKLIVPFPLNFGIIEVSDWYLPLGVLLCLVLVWLLSRRTLSAYFFLCAAAVACSALIIPLLNMTWTPLAERYMYIPSAFFVLGCVLWGLRWELTERGRTILAACVTLVLLVAVYGTSTRTLLWQDNLALFQDTVKKSPGFTAAQNELATALYARGEKEQSARVISSMQVAAATVNYQYGLITKSAALVHEGDLDGAEAVLNKVLQDPGKREADICRRLLAVYQLKVEKGVAQPAQFYPQQVRLLSRLYEITGDPFFLYRRGLVHMAQKERRLARESFEVAAARAPRNAVYLKPSLKLSQKMAD